MGLCILVVVMVGLLGKSAVAERPDASQRSRADGKDAPWKSPKNGLSQCAWKSGTPRLIFHFPTAPTAAGYSTAKSDPQLCDSSHRSPSGRDFIESSPERPAVVAECARHRQH